MPSFIVDQQLTVSLSPSDPGTDGEWSPDWVVFTLTGHLYDGVNTRPFAVSEQVVYPTGLAAPDIAQLIVDAKDQAFPV